MRIRAVTGNYRISTVFGNVPGYPLNNGFHKGVDYVSGNREVVAPQDSRVVTRGYDQTNGFYIVLESNGYRDWFSHLVGKSIQVNIGESVKQGQLLATMGNTGYASGIHLHHSLRINGVLVDPELHITGEDMLTKEQVNAIYMLAFDVNLAAVNKDVTKAFTGKPVDELLNYLLKDQSYQTHKDNINKPVDAIQLPKGLYRV